MPSACPRPNIIALVGIRLVVPILFVAAFVLSPWLAQANTITVSGGCTLPEAIDAANTNLVVGACAAGGGDDIIVLTAPVNLVSYNASFDVDGPNATPSITTTIVISGGVAGAVVERTGADEARLFHVAETGNLTLVNVTVKKGRLILYSGGAIFNLGTLTLLDSALLSNRADLGGGLFNEGNATLTNTQIISNTAPTGGGGGFINDGIATLTGSDLISNTALSGGGFYNRGNATLTNSDLLSNTSESDGGGFYNDEGTTSLTGSDLISNTALTGNGGGFFNDIDAEVTLTSSVVRSNRAQLGNGGGFFNEGTANLTGSDLISNATSFSGGGVFNDGIATLTGSDLISNTAFLSGGGVFNEGSATLTGSDILSNRVQIHGGGFANFGTATLTSSDLISNRAQLGNGGGFYSHENATTTLTNTQIISNNSGTEGGGFYNNGTATLTGSDLISNTSESDGGGLYNDENATANLTGTDLISNNSGADGGGLYNRGTATFTGSDLVSNTALTGSGGGFNNGIGAKVTLTNTQVISNTSESDGGGFYNNGTANLTNSDLISNYAIVTGGGFSNSGSGTATLTNTQIISNTVLNFGGGFYNSFGGTATLTGSDLSFNTAQLGNGGGFYNRGTATLTGSNLIANKSLTDDGGGFFNFDNATVTLTGSDLISNSARSGGGFYNDGTATLTNSVVRSNRAQSGNGGGFFNEESATTTLTGSDLISNSAQTSGGGFSNYGTVTLSLARILENEAANSGGALYQDFSGATTVELSCIVNNSDTAVVHNDGPTIDAENNWWGAPDGPSGAGLGAGDSVSSGVDFTPFLTAAVLVCPLRQAEVVFSKRVSPAGNLMPGQPLTYTLTLTNTGTLTVNKLYVADALPPAGFVLDSLTAAGAPHRMIGNTTIFTTTAPGQVATVTLSGHVDATLNDDLLLTNTGRITSPILAMLTDSVDANVVVPTLNWSSATYQSDEGGGVFNATLLLTPTNPYAAVTVQAAITDSADALAVAAMETLSFPPGSSSQTLAIQDVDDQQILTRTVQLGLTAPQGASVDNSGSVATITFAENDTAGLTVSMRSNVAEAVVGNTISYTIRITNTGNVTFTTVAASDDLVGAVTGLAGALAPNATRSATLPYVVLPEDVGELVNTVTVTATDALGGAVVEEASVTVTVTVIVTSKPKIFLPSLKRVE